MDNLSDLVQIARKQKEKIENPSSYAEELVVKLTTNGNMTHQECFDLRDEIDDFMKSDASEEDKKMVSQYTESLVMICSAIEQHLI